MSTPETTWHPESVEGRLAALEARVRELETQAVTSQTLVRAIRDWDRRWESR